MGSNEIDPINSRFGSKHNAIRFYPADRCLLAYFAVNHFEASVYWSGPSSLIDSSFEQLPQPSIAKTQMVNTAPGAFSGTWDIIDVDADWDDESEQVELRIEAQVSCSGT